VSTADNGACVQDPTNHPMWTGKEVIEIKEESRAAKFLAKYGNMSTGKQPRVVGPAGSEKDEGA
jgi:ribosomal protein L31